MDRSLFYFKVSKLELTGYAKTNYLSDPRNGISHRIVVYLWWYNYFMETCEKNWKQQLHLIMKKKLETHEASWECVWLRSLIQHTQKTCGLTFEKINATTIYEDNTACIAQL